jgi:hypothetical protein
MQTTKTLEQADASPNLPSVPPPCCGSREVPTQAAIRGYSAHFQPLTSRYLPFRKINLVFECDIIGQIYPLAISD